LRTIFLFQEGCAFARRMNNKKTQSGRGQMVLPHCKFSPSFCWISSEKETNKSKNDEMADLFDPIIELEDNFIQEGRKEGIADGIRLGTSEGFTLGYAKGFELAHELGFYLGCVEAWLSLLEKFPDKFPHLRTKDALLKIKHLLDDISFDEKMFQRIDEVRAKFKRVSSLLGFPQKYVKESGRTEALSF
jgi:hypothetical protein